MFAKELKNKLSLEKDITIEQYHIIESAILYAERFQHKPIGYYNAHQIPPKTEQAITLIVKHIISNPDNCMWNKIDSLLMFNIN